MVNIKILENSEFLFFEEPKLVVLERIRLTLYSIVSKDANVTTTFCPSVTDRYEKEGVKIAYDLNEKD